MPTISTFYGILIQMFWNDHAPPHFHALYAEDEAVIDIETLNVMKGSLPRRALALVFEWAQAHRDELIEDWDLCAQTASEENRAPQLTPPVEPRADWRVSHVEALDGFRLRVRFRDGLEGFVDMSRLVHSDRAGVFAVLADPATFAAARIDLGAVSWPGDLDLAPDAMHAAIKADGTWIL